MLIGLKAPSTAGLDCGACGYDLCDELQGAPTGSVEFNGPFCAYRLLDMGIALGSAVKTAGMLNVDSRIMYRVGAAVKRMGLVDWEFVIGVPLSVTGRASISTGRRRLTAYIYYLDECLPLRLARINSSSRSNSVSSKASSFSSRWAIRRAGGAVI